MKNKIIIIGGVLLVSITSIILIVGNQRKKAEFKKESTVDNGAVKETIEVDGILFSKTKLSYKNGITTVTATVTSNKPIPSATIKIVFVDKDDKEIQNSVQVIENITDKEQVFSTGFVGNYETAAKIKFEVVKG